MAFDGNGTFNQATTPVVSGTVISSTNYNSQNTDYNNGLSNVICKDGQTTITANLPMSNYRHTGVGNAVARSDYAAAGQVQDGAFIWCGTAGGTADALTLTPSPAITAYAAGQVFRFIAGASPNTGAATVAVSGLSAKAIQAYGAALAASQIVAGKIYQVAYDGTQFQLSSINTVPGTSANSLVQLDGTGKLPAVDGSQLTNLPVSSSGFPADGRLTLSTGVPVTTSDVTSSSTIYYTPYVGNRIALYSGSAWSVSTFTERSLALSGLTSGRPYDVFIYDNSGTITLELTAWTNDTTRATALAYQDGILVRSGATTRRYLGTIYTTGTTTTADTEAKRYVWNYYNRVQRKLAITDATTSWDYTTDAYRQANNNVANQIDMVVGVDEVMLSAFCRQPVSNSSSNVFVFGGIAKDGTSSPINGGTSLSALSAGNLPMQHQIFDRVTEGRHYYPWVEYSTATGTTLWASNSLAGIQGWIEG
jgi:hypothetical protein